MTRRIVITGASGFIGRQLVPRLKARGIDLTLVGRDPKRLGKLFPNVRRCSYGQIAKFARDFDVLIHLAVLNSDNSESEEAFKKANVDLLSDVVDEAKQAGIKTIVNVTTFHALGEARSPYAGSKRRALEFLGEVEGISVVNLFLPAVYGGDYAGKLGVLKRVPSYLRPPVLTALAAIVPSLHVDRLVSFLTSNLDSIESQVMLANPQDQNPVYVRTKRTIDLLFVVAVIGLFGWLLAIIWALVRLTSKGPGIFAQERIGKDGKPFICYKFRTMKVGTIQAGTHEVSASAVTTVGALLRKSKLDELPQIWNILRGEMSLVGPRPCLPSQEALLNSREKRGVLNILPGISGLSQVEGVDMSYPVKLARMDAIYVARRGLLLEMSIVVKTIIGSRHRDKINLRKY